MWVKLGDPLGAFDETCQLVGILRCPCAKCVGRPLQVTMQRHLPPVAGVAIRCEFVERAQRYRRDDAELFVEAQERSARKPMDAAVDHVGAAVPRSAHATEREVVLDDRDIEPARACVAAGREPRESAANNEKLRVVHGFGAGPLPLRDSAGRSWGQGLAPQMPDDEHRTG